MSKSYIFNVNDYKEIDLARISRENPEDEALLVTGLCAEYEAIILLNKNFLAKFNGKVALLVAGDRLCRDWGWDKDRYLASTDILEYHRGRYLDLGSIPKVIEELRDAKKFLKNKQNKSVIKVTELDINDKSAYSRR